MKKLIYLLLAFLPGLSYALDTEIAICQVQIQKDGSAFIRPCEEWTTKNSCGRGSYISWKVRPKAPRLMFDTALAAHLSGKRVIVRTDGLDTSCNDDYDTTSMIRILK